MWNTNVAFPMSHHTWTTDNVTSVFPGLWGQRTRPDIFPHSGWWFGGPRFSSPHSTQPSSRNIYSTLCFFLLTSFEKFTFPSALDTWTNCQKYQKQVRWLWCYCAWLAARPGSMVSRGGWETRANDAAWPSITPERCPHLTDAVIHTGGPTKKQVRRWTEHTWQKTNNSAENICIELVLHSDFEFASVSHNPQSFK